MNQEMLCTWLGVAKTEWPPDPRTLLGLRPDEQDPTIIEKRVQDRMAKLRCYQLSYPEEATEGMNRVAEAFIALTEVQKSAQESGIVATARVDETVSAPPSAEWQEAPPPVRQERMVSPGPQTDPDFVTPILPSKPYVAPETPIRRGIDLELMRELAEESEEASSNLATLEAVIERVDRTRALLHAWDRLGKHFKGTVKKISPKELDAYAARLDRVARALEGFPAFLGSPGKPGYRVAVQARLRLPLTLVRGMSEDQREELTSDWQTGRQVLLAHRRYLRRLFKSMRHRSALGLFFHAVRSIVNDHPIWTLVAFFLAIAILLAVVAAIRR